MSHFQYCCVKKVPAVAVLAIALLAPVPGQAQVQPPQALYMVSVGVSQYQNPMLNLQSAAKDATDIGNAFQAQQGKLFNKVEVTTLTNTQATAANIKNTLNQLRLKANPYSYVIVYLAGHGNNDSANGEFYFHCHDFNPFQKDQTSVSWRQMQQALNAMPGKVIVILDSCRSGAVAGGDMIVLTSAMAHQNAGENALNGYFTQALLEALSGRADTNRNNIITLAEIDLYVSERVEQLSAGKQQVTMTRPPNVPSTLPLVSLNSPVVVNSPPVPVYNPGPPGVFNPQPPVYNLQPTGVFNPQPPVVLNPGQPPVNPNPPIIPWQTFSSPTEIPPAPINSSGPLYRPRIPR